MHLRWHDEAGVHIGENEFLARRPKEFELAQPTISIELEAGKLRLSTDVPALFVTIDHGGANIWSDNGFTLLPGSAKTLTLQRDRGGLKDNLSVSCLNRFCS
jgi:beta-mannosidase